ncbi:MAG: NAD(P)H-hydrate dehydratase [Sphingomonas sp.]|uniref:NAD(P)H-hydrate dehydratase n=1 Tax=Sphingomonas sp. TaxID=28214 RepID=UPI0025DFCB52|nr:NAD(P)H-hydrate dehydratase [Sphingomonas sp.]MBY0284480.1 NAD(P)H-hydrate dehydratase [Sphingomonas sp.]
MMSLEGAPIVTAAQMRAAEDIAIAEGTSAATLMQRAGAGVADWVRRLASGSEILFLCGPGNNGGDGYVAARILRREGLAVRVAASGEPRTDIAAAARAGWDGPVEALDAEPAPVLVDCLFGTGLTRALDPGLAAPFARFARAARLVMAVDVPSGLEADRAEPLGRVPDAHLTLALGALKPAHVLQPGASICGAVKLVELGIDVPRPTRVVARPVLRTPGPYAHKYSRGMVAIIGGAMPGATALAGEAALRAGAGYVVMLGGQGGPDAIVHRAYDAAALDDRRIGAVLVGPGLGRDARARERLAAALASGHPLVIDGDALHLIDPEALRTRAAPVILTPHAGEFAALFGEGAGNKIDRTLAAAVRSGAVVVFKGADTVIAAPDGRIRVASDARCWLSTAGTGDVLAGAIAGLLAGGLDPLFAAEAGVWLHADAARRLGGAFIADDLARAMTSARASI